MKLADLIARVDMVKPNSFDKELKTSWVNEIEHRAYDEVISKARGHFGMYRPYDYDADAERALAVPDPYVSVYEYYLYSKIDMLYSEIDRYNNDVIAFDSAWKDYASWYRRAHYPKNVFGW